jgi:hypothetical protein
MMLPEIPSELIRLAIKDLELCEQDSNYTIDMSDWYADRGEYCSVCLAGAVMVQELDVVPLTRANGTKQMSPAYVPNAKDRDKLYALNILREGLLGDFCLYFDRDVRVWKDVWSALECGDYLNNMVKYAYDSVAFKKQMLHIADVFEEFGH